MATKQQVIMENQPNASRVVESLRYLGYDNISAICDIIDNSIDALATEIRVVVSGDKDKHTIQIIDNGCGMDAQTLDQALRLGSDTSTSTSKLGKFGMGLCTASMSIGKRTEVITKKENGRLLKSATDVDVMVEQNNFVKEFGEAETQDEVLFKSLSLTHGTVVTISKCDNFKLTTTYYKNLLIRELGRIFRCFINNGIKIYVNNQQVSSLDVLMLNEPGTIVGINDTFDFPYVDEQGNNQVEQITIRLVDLKNTVIDPQEIPVSQASSGFYVMRNEREILKNTWIDEDHIAKRHPTLNYVRGEIYFTAALDKYFGVNFKKQDIVPKHELVDFLAKKVHSMINKMKWQKKRDDNEDANKIIDYKKIAKKIDNKIDNLKIPDAVKKPQVDEPKKEKEEKQKTNRVGNVENFKKKNVRFETQPMTIYGPIYESVQEGKTVVITWNTDHPFFDSFITENKENVDLIEHINFFIYSMACAELANKNPMTEETFNNFTQTLSNNVRVLLSE